jgi:hypothetical protein
MSRIFSTAELLINCLLALGALGLLANSRFCFFNQASCGMVEPLLAVFALALSVPLFFAGFLRRKGQVAAGNLAYIPALVLLFFLYGQARSWW